MNLFVSMITHTTTKGPGPTSSTLSSVTTSAIILVGATTKKSGS